MFHVAILTCICLSCKQEDLGEARFIVMWFLILSSIVLYVIVIISNSYIIDKMEDQQIENNNVKEEYQTSEHPNDNVIELETQFNFTKEKEKFESCNDKNGSTNPKIKVRHLTIDTNFAEPYNQTKVISCPNKANPSGTLSDMQNVQFIEVGGVSKTKQPKPETEMLSAKSFNHKHLGDINANAKCSSTKGTSFRTIFSRAIKPQKQTISSARVLSNFRNKSITLRVAQSEQYKLKKINLKDANLVRNQTTEIDSNDPDSKFCLICYITYALRGRHCSICNACIAGYDHHCFFLGICIGEKNKFKYILFLTATLVEVIYTSVLVSCLCNL